MHHTFGLAHGPSQEFGTADLEQLLLGLALPKLWAIQPCLGRRLHTERVLEKMTSSTAVEDPHDPAGDSQQQYHFSGLASLGRLPDMLVSD